MNAAHDLEKYRPVETFPPPPPVSPGEVNTALANGDEPERDNRGVCGRFPDFPGCEDEGDEDEDDEGGDFEPNQDTDEDGILPDLPGSTASPAPGTG